MHWGYIYSDSKGYIGTTNYFFDYENADRFENRMIRPTTMILAGAITPLFGIVNSFVIVNTIFVILAAFFLYRFVLQLYGRDRLAFYSALLFVTSIPILRYGFAVITDAGAYFFTILTIYIIYNIKDDIDIKRIIAISFMLFVGALTKEHIMFLAPIYLLLSKGSNKKILFKSISIIFIMFVFISSYYIAYDVNPFTHYNRAPDSGYTYDNEESWGIKAFVLSFGGFLYLPLFSLLGFLMDNNRKRLINFYYILISVAPIFIWPAIEYRITFILFPIIIPLASIGIERFSELISKKPFFSILNKRKYEILIIILYIVSSFLYAHIFHSPDLYITSSGQAFNLMDINHAQFLEQVFG